MSVSKNNDKQQERPSTYVVQDRRSEDELTRLAIQDQMLTSVMGGVLPEQDDPASFRRVLDIACGPASWVIEAAKTYPTMSLVGIDISARMIDYARAQAVAQGVSDRVDLRVMDALAGLGFPDDSFDLVNLRLGVSFLRTWDWPRLLAEMLRVTRTNGVIRLTEGEMLGAHCTSPAYIRFVDLLMGALHQAGHLFEPGVDGLTAHLPALLARYLRSKVQTREYAQEYPAGSAVALDTARDIGGAFKTLRPFIAKWGVLPADYDALYQQAVEEMNSPDYATSGRLITVWGGVPAKRSSLHIP